MGRKWFVAIMVVPVNSALRPAGCREDVDGRGGAAYDVLAAMITIRLHRARQILQRSLAPDQNSTLAARFLGSPYCELMDVRLLDGLAGAGSMSCFVNSIGLVR